MTNELTETLASTSLLQPSKRRRIPVVGTVAYAVLAGYVLLAIIGPLVMPYPPNQLNVGPRLAPPGPEFWMGTDALGRDLLSRVIAAIRPALLAAATATAIALVVGTLFGLAAGYWRGAVDGILSRIVDFLFAVPEYLLAILVLAVLGSGLLNAAIAIGIVFIPRFARTVRGSTLEIMSRNYIDAARLSGRGGAWIMTRHLLPNIASPLVVITAINLSTATGAYAALSFLGFGVRPPDADFGSMIADSLQYLTADAWVVVPPAVAFVVLILAINLAGDALRDRLDPRSVSR
ncbi:ABC transporter permease [Agromyces mediolanus]|uniref:ABC transporter permease n=1 Tax=Agromyces mediolanus TaxID=41986 RepID=UPI0038343523